MTEQRTATGAPLRRDLDRLQLGIEIPPGKKGVIQLAIEQADGRMGAEVGAATLTRKGWKVDAGVRVELGAGRTVRTVGKLRIEF